MSDRVYGVVLAAGAGRRLGQPKATAVYRSERFVDRAVRVLHEGGVVQVVVVLGAVMTEVPGATVLRNPDWASGMAGSLQVAMRWLLDRDAESMLVTLVDEVHLASADVTAIRQADGELVATQYGEHWSHPVRIHRAHWKALSQELRGDRGARPYLERHAAELTLVPARQPAGILDIDSREQLDAAGPIPDTDGTPESGTAGETHR